MTEHAIPLAAVASAARAHAVLSASGAKKWLRCTMSPAMELKIEARDKAEGKSDDTKYSREGTFAHAVGELRIKLWLLDQDAGVVADYRALVDESAESTEFYNAEFSDYVQQYVDFVTAKIVECYETYGRQNVAVLLEQRLDYSAWAPEGFGTGDVVIIVPGKVIVIDLKFGKGVYVDGEDNDQIKLYGLGAYARYDSLYDFTEVEVVIVQPRKDNVSGETIPVVDLLVWADLVVRPAAAVAWAATQGDVSAARFMPGYHCKDGFCRAREQCTARALHALGLAQSDVALDDPTLLTVDQVERALEIGKPVAGWVADAEKFLLAQAEAGAELTRFKLVEGRSNRTIVDEPKAAEKLIQAGVPREALFKEPAMKGITDLERIVGKKKFSEVLGDLVQKPKGKTTLASIHSAKPAVEPKRQSASDEFNDL